MWIHRLPAEVLFGYADTLASKDPASLPLYGIPFAINAAATPLGATGLAQLPADADYRLTNGQVRVAVVGAHLSGLPLNWQLTSRKGRLISSTRTAPKYRFYALPDGKRPGLIQVKTGGADIACKVWEMPAHAFGSFVAAIPAPLGIGKLELADGSTVCGFICEGIGVAQAQDITEFGGWLAWRAHCVPT